MKEFYKHCQVAVPCLAFLLMSSSLFSQNKRSLTAYSNKVLDTLIHGFWVSLPASYDTSSQQYPLLLMIHGAGELGAGTSARTRAGKTAERTPVSYTHLTLPTTPYV